MDVNVSRETCGYEPSVSCGGHATAAKSFGDISYDVDISWEFSLDCEHLLPCGKCERSNEECPEHAKRPSYPTYPVYPYVPQNPCPEPWKPYITPYWYPSPYTICASTSVNIEIGGRPV